jgi:Zn-dependent protease
VNPLPHIDPIGSVLVPGLLFLSNAGFLFGWAKPVPYNPYNLRNQRWGEAIVAAAGPLTNFLLALIFALLIRFAGSLSLDEAFISIAAYIVFINVLLGCFNAIPVPPLDGSKVIDPFLPYRARIWYQNLGRTMERMGILVTFLFIFIFITFLWKPFSEVVFTIVSFLIGVSPEELVRLL